MPTTRFLTLTTAGLAFSAMTSISCSGLRTDRQTQAAAQDRPLPQAATATQAATRTQPAAPAPTRSSSPGHGSGTVVALTSANFDATVNRPGAIVLVDFAADWCGPCRQLQPVLDKVAADFAGQVIVARVDVDDDPQLANRFSANTIPALFYFQNGQVQSSSFGVVSEQAITAQLGQLLP